MVDVSTINVNFEMTELQNQKQIDLDISGGVNTVKNFQVYPASEDGVQHNNVISTVQRNFVIMVEYEPTGANNLGIRVIRATAANSDIVTVIDAFNNQNVTPLGMQAVPISYRSGDEVEYLFFFLSRGIGDGTLFDINSQRIPIELSGTVTTALGTTANHLEYTASNVIINNGLISDVDVFFTSTTPP